MSRWPATVAIFVVAALVAVTAAGCGGGERRGGDGGGEVPAEPATELPAAEQPAGVPPESGPAVPEQLAGLPSDAARAVLAVRAAAEAGDFDALRRHMAEHFSWSFGGNVSADEAIAHWRERPAVVAELVEMIDRGCRSDPGTGYVVCPPAYGRDPDYLGFRAGFDRQNGEWKMIFFVAGD